MSARVANEQVFEDVKGTLRRIRAALPPHPNASRKAGMPSHVEFSHGRKVYGYHGADPTVEITGRAWRFRRSASTAVTTT